MENIVIIALLLAGIVAFVKVTLDFLTNLAVIRKETAIAIAGKTDERLDQLHAEIAELRETAMQHEESLQQLLDNVDQRVANVESRSGAIHTPQNLESKPLIAGCVTE